MEVSFYNAFLTAVKKIIVSWYHITKNVGKHYIDWNPAVNLKNLPYLTEVVIFKMSTFSWSTNNKSHYIIYVKYFSIAYKMCLQVYLNFNWYRGNKLVVIYLFTTKNKTLKPPNKYKYIGENIRRWLPPKIRQKHFELITSKKIYSLGEKNTLFVRVINIQHRSHTAVGWPINNPIFSILPNLHIHQPNSF